jgi:hypothetical protein
LPSSCTFRHRKVLAHQTSSTSSTVHSPTLSPGCISLENCARS